MKCDIKGYVPPALRYTILSYIFGAAMNHNYITTSRARRTILQLHAHVHIDHEALCSTLAENPGTLLQRMDHKARNILNFCVLSSTRSYFTLDIIIQV